MKKIRTIFSLLTFLFLTGLAFGQNNALITVQAAKTLGTNQQQIRNKIALEATTKKEQLIQLNLEALKSPTVTIQLLDGQTLTVTEERKSEQYGRKIWVGKNEATKDNIILIISENEVIGSITNGLKIYSIRSLGNGTQVLVEIDQSKYPPELCNQADEVHQNENNSEPNGSENLIQNFSASSHNGYECNLRLLVAYTASSATAAVTSGFGNIQNLILLAVEETNQSYINSAINQRVELAHITQVNYTETGVETSLNHFAASNDGNMDEIHTLRNLYTADVGVLFVNLPNDNLCGVAKTIHTENNPSQAFCVTRFDCATGNYTFGHEIGHLQGARHDEQSDPTTTPFAYGHGFVRTAGNWRTIMATVGSCNTCVRL